MSRGVRKSQKEKLTERLEAVNGEILQHSESLEKLKAEKKDLEKSLEMQEIAELSAILKEKNLSVNELKAMVNQAG